ncbi:MAG: response regulator [Candidatus Nealsonbacteria bacterium]|nr:response regulator [Candidatus Nealsonbacteria bacterium]
MSKILMVEDDIFLRKIYREKFLREGFNFLEATNGEEGLNKVVAEKPDLVLLDLMLPRKNGFDVLIEMKRNKATARIPVVILSNLGQDSDVKRGLELGANDYLVKTDVNLSDVVAKAKEWLLKAEK